jgi:hypothetical protein
MLAATLRWATLPKSRPFHRSLYDEYAPAYDSTPQGRQFEAVDVSRNTSSAAYAVVNASRIAGAAHLIPEEPTCASVVQGAWVVNSHIDLATWNDVYGIDANDIAAASRV